MPLNRDGVVKCAIRPVISGARAIRRVPRASLSAEVVSLCAAIDICYRIQSVLRELVFGEFAKTRIQAISSSTFLTPCPSELPPSGSSLSPLIALSPHASRAFRGPSLDPILRVMVRGCVLYDSFRSDSYLLSDFLNPRKNSIAQEGFRDIHMAGLTDSASALSVR